LFGFVCWTACLLVALAMAWMLFGGQRTMSGQHPQDAPENTTPHLPIDDDDLD